MLEGFHYCYSLRVRYAEIDGQMIVFNSHYLTYCDVAITEYLRNLGIVWNPDDKKYDFDFALVKTTVEYKGSGKLDDILNVYVKISRFGNSSFTTNFVITCQDDPTPLVLVESIYVGFDSATGKGVPVPDSFRSLIESFENGQ